MDITFAFQAVITVIIGLIAVFVVPWIKEKKLYSWVSIAVKAAEQLYKDSGMGKVKKAFVLDFLASKGYKVDTDSIDLMIEAAVLELKEKLFTVDQTTN